MAEKCFCHLNGYAVKDSTARKEIEILKEQVNNDNHVDSEARAAALSVLNELNEHKAEEVIDSTARSAILGLEEDINELAGAACNDTTARSAAATANNLAISAGTAATAAQTTANEAKAAAATNANSITGHETRITALETAGSGGGGLSLTEMSYAEVQTFLSDTNNVGRLIYVQDLDNAFGKNFSGFCPVSLKYDELYLNIGKATCECGMNNDTFRIVTYAGYITKSTSVFEYTYVTFKTDKTISETSKTVKTSTLSNSSKVKYYLVN